MGGAPQDAMRVASQIWQVVFALQTLQVFCLAFRKKAQYVVVNHSKDFKKSPIYQFRLLVTEICPL
jgi:hypothetical protein